MKLQQINQMKKQKTTMVRLIA